MIPGRSCFARKLRPNPNHPHHSACWAVRLPGVSAVGKEHLRVATGAGGVGVNAGGSNTGLPELKNVGLYQVEIQRIVKGSVRLRVVVEKKRVPCLQGARFLVVNKELRGVGKLSLKFIPHLLADPVAADTDARPDGGPQVPVARALGLFQQPHAFLCDAPDRSAPAAVERRDHSLFCVY